MTKNLTRSEMARLFSDHFGGRKNFVTPEVIEFIQHKDRIMEVSKGELFNKPVFGLTVLQLVESGNKLITIRDPEFNGGRETMAEIEVIIETIKNR